MVSMFLQIINGAPWWVWGICVYLIVVGAQATQTHQVYIPRLFIIPAVALAAHYPLFCSGNIPVILTYLVFLCVGTAVGILVIRNNRVEILKNKISVIVPGNFHTLGIFMAFFCSKCVFGYLKSQPSFTLEMLMIDTVLTGMFSGFFLGKCLSYVYKFIRYRD